MAESWAAGPRGPLWLGWWEPILPPACRLDSLQGCSPPPPTQSSHLSLAAPQNPFLSRPSVPAWLSGCWILEGTRPLCPSGLPTRKSWSVIPGGACKVGRAFPSLPPGNHLVQPLPAVRTPGRRVAKMLMEETGGGRTPRARLEDFPLVRVWNRGLRVSFVFSGSRDVACLTLTQKRG